MASADRLLPLHPTDSDDLIRAFTRMLLMRDNHFVSSEQSRDYQLSTGWKVGVRWCTTSGPISKEGWKKKTSLVVLPS